MVINKMSNNASNHQGQDHQGKDHQGQDPPGSQDIKQTAIPLLCFAVVYQKFPL